MSSDKKQEFYGAVVSSDGPNGHLRRSPVLPEEPETSVIPKEEPFELKIKLIVTGFGRAKDQYQLGKTVAKELAVVLHRPVSVTFRVDGTKYELTGRED